jgi:cystathionine beta-lyase family protein involved in aluminum resistance
MYKDLKIDSELLKLANEAEKELEEIYSHYEENSLLNSAKVLSAFQKFMVSGTDFCEITGYGYSDAGRDKLEQIYADIFKAEDALVRPQIMSGTHALSLTFFGLLKHGDTMISITGTPYDSLKGVIGIEGDSRNSLIANGVKYEEIDLIDNDFDIETIKTRLSKNDVKLVEIQRSRGYSQRKSLTIEKIERVIKAIREVNKEVIIMIDNCYGDFVEDKEPIEVGADIIVGSLMKNLGGGIAKTGGYIVGNKDLINDVAERFSAPCIGKDIGANMNQNMSFYKGLYLSPAVVCSSLKTMTFASLMLEKLGFDVDPKYNEYRTDVIQTITLNDPDKMVKFCQGIQSACPVESYVSPIPSDMPGYNHQVVMASGSFTEGSTIELSCDGPVIPPYTIFMQGGLTYEYGKLGILLALNKILNK